MLGLVVSIGFAVVLLIVLCFARMKETSRVQERQRETLRGCVTEVKEEVEKILGAYPLLNSSTVIDGFNEDKEFDVGNVYAPNSNLTFPMRTPSKPVNTTGGTMIPNNPIELIVAGTVGDYSVSGLSRFRSGENFRVTYSSVSGEFVEKIS